MVQCMEAARPLLPILYEGRRRECLLIQPKDTVSPHVLHGNLGPRVRLLADPYLACLGSGRGERCE